MSWAKHDDAVKAHHKALLESYGKLRRLLGQGLKHPGLAPAYCQSLITYVKMRDSLRRTALQSQPIDIEKVLQALPPVPMVLMRRNNEKVDARPTRTNLGQQRAKSSGGQGEDSQNSRSGHRY